MINYGYIRDSITIDSSFFEELKAELKAKNIAPKSTILIAARQIKHAAGYTLRLSDQNLIIAADLYDTNGGSIDVSGVAGAAGAKGATGAKGYASATGYSDKPGGPGANGGPGGAPTAGNQLTFYCKEIKNAKLLAMGGNGGAGGQGGTGGEGGSGFEIVHNDKGPKSKIPVGTDGGKGGNGGAASAGAPGGKINVFYIKGAAPVMSVAGGAAAVGGAAGAGGKGGPTAKNGPVGAKGANAAKGADGVASAKVMKDADFWAGLRSVLGLQQANAWAAYRERVGDFMFRNGYGKGISNLFTVPMSATEFRSAGMLNPASSGKVRHMMVVNGMNPLGMRRDMYLTPEFPRYEKAFTDYAPMVQNMLGTAKDLLLHADMTQANKDRMVAQLQHFESQKEIAQRELEDANLQKLHAEGTIAGIQNNINEVKQQIEAKKKEITEARMELDGAFIGTVLTVIGAVAAVVGSCVTAGASLAAVPGLLVAAEECWSAMSKDASGNLFYGGMPLAEVINWKDKDGNLSPEVKPEVKDAAAGLGKVVESGTKAYGAVMDLVDKAKVLDDITRSKVNGELENELKALMKRAAELEFDKAQAKIILNQAQIRIEIANLKIKQAETDADAAKGLINNWTKNNVLLGSACRLIVRRAQEYINVLLRFQFMATRALEIYALRNYSDTIPYTLGFLHPDEEEKAYAAMARGEAADALPLMSAYLNSWSKLPQIIHLRNEYETYREGLVTQSEYWTIDNPAQVAKFQQFAALDFEVTLDQLLDNRFECKVEGTDIALVGATATQPMINCVLVHEGAQKIQRMDGKVIAYEYPRRGAPRPAAKSDAAIGQVPPSDPEAFWGRSPAARWRLYIEPEIMSGAAVDLSGLTKIVIAVKYKAFAPPLGSNAKPEVPQAAMAIA